MTYSGDCESRVSRVLTDPAAVNLIALLTRFTRICFTRAGSPRTSRGNLRPNAGGKLQPFLGSPMRHHLDDVFEDRVHVEVDRLQFQFPSLDLREVQDVVEEIGKRLAGRLDEPCKTLLLWIERTVQQQVGDPNHAIERRANFMAHIGQEFALGAVGRLGRFFCLDDLLLDSAPLCEVFRDSGDTVNLTSLVADGQCSVTNPSNRAIGTSNSILRCRTPHWSAAPARTSLPKAGPRARSRRSSHGDCRTDCGKFAPKPLHSGD